MIGKVGRTHKSNRDLKKPTYLRVLVRAVLVLSIMTKLSKQDWGMVKVDADPDFDPERNKRIIAETIKKNNLLRARKKRESNEKIGERSNAVAQYLNDLNKGRTQSNVIDYFGRHEIARLRGEEILGVIRSKIGDVTKQKIKEKAQAWASKS